MSTYNTIHIFHFGTVQVIGEGFNTQVPTASVQAHADSVIDNVWSKKPEDNTGTKSYHAINIFKDMFSDWQPKVEGETGYRTKYDQLDSALIEALVTAVKNV